MEAKGSAGQGIIDDSLARVLFRSAVCRRVPAKVQSRLNRAILLRSSSRATTDALAAKYKLQERFGISPAALRSYARRLEDLVRPVLASQLVAAVLGCMPAAYRREVLAGGQVLLLSRLVGCMSNGMAALSPAEMAKVASALSGLARTTRGGRTGGLPDRKKRERPSATGERPSKLAEAVRAVYGLNWPPPDDKPPVAEAARSA